MFYLQWYLANESGGEEGKPLEIDVPNRRRRREPKATGNASEVRTRAGSKMQDRRLQNQVHCVLGNVPPRGAGREPAWTFHHGPRAKGQQRDSNCTPNTLIPVDQNGLYADCMINGCP
ncbi:uncharacterized protein LOC144826538 [Lissotriton helveticus]